MCSAVRNLIGCVRYMLAAKRSQVAGINHATSQRQICNSEYAHWSSSKPSPAWCAHSEERRWFVAVLSSLVRQQGRDGPPMLGGPSPLKKPPRGACLAWASCPAGNPGCQFMKRWKNTPERHKWNIARKSAWISLFGPIWALPLCQLSQELRSLLKVIVFQT